LKSGPRSKTSATPVKAWSNSASETAIGPKAGSFRYALPFLNPSRTRKWLKFQCTIIGSGSSFSCPGSFLYPFATSPYVRAALRTLLALLPSRDTPHAARSSSSGTTRPKWPSTIASAAAPHSTASIWSTVGVLTRRAAGGFGLAAGAGGPLGAAGAAGGGAGRVKAAVARSRTLVSSCIGAKGYQ
jgi:hypothetical protein